MQKENEICIFHFLSVFLNLFLLYFIYCVYTGTQLHMYMYHRVYMEVRIQLAGVGSVLLPYGFLGSSSDFQAQWQLPIYHEASSPLTLSETVSLPRNSLCSIV